MTAPAGLSDEQCDAIRDEVHGRFDTLTPNIQRTRTFQFSLIRAGAAAVMSQREAYQRGYAAGAAASVPREPVAWYTPLMGNYAHVVWGKRPDTPMEWAPLYAAPAVAQDSDKLGIAIRALKLIEHATKLEPDDGSYHEAAYSIAHRALSDLKWGTVNGAFPAVAQEV